MPSRKSDVTDFAPLFDGLLLLSNPFSDFHVVQGDGQLKLVVKVGSQVKGHLFLTVCKVKDLQFLIDIKRKNPNMKKRN